jgi:hypothetical protein
MLDASPLSLLCQRSTARGVPEIRAWLRQSTAAGAAVYIISATRFTGDGSRDDSEFSNRISSRGA